MFAPIHSPKCELPPLPTSDEERDARLLGQIARRRDCAAFETLHALHIAAVTDAALRICGNRSTAEEIAQDTFWTLWQRADRLALRTVRVKAWLKTVARNAAIDAMRRSRSKASVSLEELAVPLPSGDEPARTVLAHESGEELQRALAELSPKQRYAIELIFFRGMTYCEAATLANLPSATLKSRVRLALRNLRRAMTCG